MSVHYAAPLDTHFSHGLLSYLGRKRFPVSTAPRFAEALRRLQAARLAEVEALGEFVSALAGATPGTAIGLNDMCAGPPLIRHADMM